MKAAFSREDMARISPAPEYNAAQASDGEAAPPAEIRAIYDQRPALSGVVISGLVRVSEFAIILGAGFGVHAAYVTPADRFGLPYFIAIPAMTAAALVAFQVIGANSVAALRRPVQETARLAAAWSFVALAALAVVFFARLDGVYSRVWLAGFYLVTLACLTAERMILAVLMRRLTALGRLERRTVIVGGGPAGEQLLKDLSRQKDSDLRICGVFDDRFDERSPDIIAGYPKLGKVSDLVEYARHTRVDLVIFAMPITAEERLLQMLRKLWVLPIDIRLAAHTNKLRFRPRAYSYIGTVPVFDVFDKPIADWDVVLKWIFDKVVGTLALIALSPVMLATAIAVKLDSRGPVFFKQKRHGFNNEVVEVFKFRSMYVDRLDHAAAKQVTRDDPRVTRVGRFIRKTSLDELPQLFNVVFKGNLSLVGPRPHATQARAADRNYDEVVDGYFARHRVKPGITGWAQVNGFRGETDTAEKIQNRVDYDLYYIENWSILFDLYILCITPFALLKAENAY